jgi:hypothetical protein
MTMGFKPLQNVKSKSLLVMNQKRKAPLVQSIKDLVAASHELARRAEHEYACEVEAVIEEQSRDPKRIEFLLDGLLDFCFDTGVLSLYKRLCRYYFKINPATTAEYIHAYRDMWDSEEAGDE